MTHRLRSRLLGFASILFCCCATLPAQTRPAGAVAARPAGVTDAPTTRPAIPTTRESRYSRSADAEIRFQEGLLHYQGQRLAQAEQDFKDVLRFDRADVDAYYWLGLSQLDQNKAADSVPNFDQAIRLDPTFDEARAARALAEIRATRYDDAQRDIEALSANPRFTGYVHYLRGQLAYAKGDLETAAREFDAAKAAGGIEAAPAAFYEGLTYLRMRELVRARATFRESQGPEAERDPLLSSASRQLDRVLAVQAQPSKPWEAQITLSYEYDSNVVQIGSNIPLPGGISGQDDWRWVVQPRGSYSFIQNPTLEIGVEGNGYFSWQQELSDFDIASYQGGPFINYKLMDNLYASFRYGFNYIEFGHDPFLTRNVVTPQLTYIEKNFGYTSGFYQFQTRQFDGPTLPALDRDGQSNAVGIVQGINLPAIFRDAGPANLEISYRFDIQETKGSDFDGKFNTVGATFYTPLPFWKLRADTGVNFSFDNYDHPNSLDASGDKREDFEFNVTAGITKDINKNIAVRVDYSFTDHNSNVDTGTAKPYEFDRHQVGFRLIFTF
jgi:tetratricopeptide (TPR) repeat protein